MGQGSVARTKAFRDQLNLPFPLLADPRRLTYQAYGLLKMNFRGEASLNRFKNTFKTALTHGMTFSRDQDMNQLGGVFLVGVDGRIAFAYRAEHMDDLPRHDALLAAARSSEVVT